MRTTTSSLFSNTKPTIIRLTPRQRNLVCAGIFLVGVIVILFFYTVLKKSSNTTFSLSRIDKSFDPLSSYTGPTFSVLITGGAGFIGSHVVEAFLGSTVTNHVIVLDNLLTGKLSNLDTTNPRLVFVEGSITDTSLLKQLFEEYDDIFYVYHLGALISAPESVLEPKKYFETNSLGTLNLLESVTAYGLSVKKVLFASSAAVYSNADPIHARDEYETPMDCRSPYAQTKLDGEFLLASMAERSNRWDGISFRFFNVFGERQDPNSAYSAVIPAFINGACIKNSPLKIFGSGKQTRDFVYVKDLVQAMMHISLLDPSSSSSHVLETDFSSSPSTSPYKTVFNIGYQDSMTITALAEQINELCGRKKNRIDFEEPRLGDVMYSLASNRRLRKSGWSQRWEKNEAIKKTVNWFLDHAKS